MLEHSAPDTVSTALTVVLGFAILPIWLAMGFADYFCHRASDIEHTSGTRESILHLIQFTCTGVPLLAALLLRVDAGLLLLVTAFAVVHHVVAYIDVRYANATRIVTPIEQMVHSFLEILPVTALLLVSALNASQVHALYSGSGADFGFHIRLPPLPAWYVAAILISAFVFGLLPYLEGVTRCVRSQASRSVISKRP